MQLNDRKLNQNAELLLNLNRRLCNDDDKLAADSAGLVFASALVYAAKTQGLAIATLLERYVDIFRGLAKEADERFAQDSEALDGILYELITQSLPPSQRPRRGQPS